MARVLIAEESVTLADSLQRLLEQAGHTVEIARNGAQALTALRREPADVVIADLHLPDMHGMQLVERLREEYPQLPVIFATGADTNDMLVEILPTTAPGVLTEESLEAELFPTLKSALVEASGERGRDSVLGQLSYHEFQFVLPNDLDLVGPLVRELDEMLQRMRLCDQPSRMRIGVALHEALVNAIVHGNLEVDSEHREGEGQGYSELIRERQQLAPFRDRRVYVTARVSPAQAEFVIRDEGPGFQPDQVDDPTDPAHLERPHGRGLHLIRLFLDDVRHNESGNEITLVKRKVQGDWPDADPEMCR